jgi:mono/diheme cytochrome c family protein
MLVRSSRVLLFVPAAAAALLAQSGAEPATVWDGVFTADQSRSGRALYDEHCSGCHRGGQSSVNPENFGDGFQSAWGEDYLSSLYDVIEQTMPRGNPNSLQRAEYVDIVAYLLDSNGFPEGDATLAHEDLAAIRVESEEGPGEVPNYALVLTDGCLMAGDPGQWLLSNASPLSRTRNPEPSSASRLESLAEAPLGSDLYELIYIFPSPDAFAGHRVELKGLLIRDTDPDRINVSSFTSVAESCGTSN